MSTPEIIPFIPESPAPLLREIAPAATFPISSLGPLQQAVEAAHDISQAPIAIAGQSALSVAALAVQPFADVQTLGGFAPLSLFCLTIAQSGERKSATDRILMSELKQYEIEADRDYRDAIERWRIASAFFKADHDRIMNGFRRRGGDREAAQADIEALGPEPSAPLAPNVTATEPTLEGLHRLYQTGQPSLGLFSDEGGQFLGGHAMNSENRLKTVAGLSSLWDGQAINRTRAGDGATTLYGRRLSAHLMIQPVAARPLLDDPMASGQGFLARFLITEPSSAIGKRFSRGGSAEAQEAQMAFGRHLQEILSTPKPTHPENPQQLEPRQLPLSASAEELLWRYYEVIEAEQIAGGDLEYVRPFASKSPEQAARIAGILTLWQDLDAREVSAQAIEWGITLAQYYLFEAKRLTEAVGVSRNTDRAEILRKWLLSGWPERAVSLDRNPDFVLPSDVVQHGPNSFRETQSAKRFLATLASSGWLVKLPAHTEVDRSPRKLAYRIIRFRDVV